MARHSHQKRMDHTTKVMWRVAILAAAIMVLLVLFMPGRGYFHYRGLRKQAEALYEENRALRERNSDLAVEIDRLKKDEQYLEELARKKHGLLKKNEEVYDFGKKK